MGFSSSAFLYLFLPVVFIVYYITPQLKYKNQFALAASLLFYAFGEPNAIWIMLLSVLINYVCGRLMICRQKKSGFCGMLHFKYRTAICFQVSVLCCRTFF